MSRSGTGWQQLYVEAVLFHIGPPIIANHSIPPLLCAFVGRHQHELELQQIEEQELDEKQQNAFSPRLEKLGPEAREEVAAMNAQEAEARKNPPIALGPSPIPLSDLPPGVKLPGDESPIQFYFKRKGYNDFLVRPPPPPHLLLTPTPHHWALCLSCPCKALLHPGIGSIGCRFQALVLTNDLNFHHFAILQLFCGLFHVRTSLECRASSEVGLKAPSGLTSMSLGLSGHIYPHRKFVVQDHTVK